MVIRIDRKIMSQNVWQRAHWAIRKQEKESWVKEMIAVKCNHKLKNATGRMKVQITVGLKRLYDRDNISIKACLDSLTKTGLIIDDSEEWIELEQTRQVKAKEPYVEIELKEMESIPSGHNSLPAEFLRNEGAR